jgi:hypothetical protein
MVNWSSYFCLKLEVTGRGDSGVLNGIDSSKFAVKIGHNSTLTSKSNQFNHTLVIPFLGIDWNNVGMTLISRWIPGNRLNLIWRGLIILGVLVMGAGLSVEWSRMVSSMTYGWVAQGISFGFGVLASVVFFVLIGFMARPKSDGQSAPQAAGRIPAKPISQFQSSKMHQDGPFDELRLKHCAIMMGVADTESVTYLIPCIGNVSRASEGLPDEAFSAVLESAAKLRENGVAVKVLIPNNEYPGAIYFPPMSKYMIGVRQFPVPKSFFSGN